jgi:hypothetical protein
MVCGIYFVRYLFELTLAGCLGGRIRFYAHCVIRLTNSAAQRLVQYAEVYSFIRKIKVKMKIKV